MLGKLFRSKDVQAAESAASSEVRLVEQRAIPIFHQNNSFFYGRGEASIRLSVELVTLDPPLDVIGLFLAGIIMEVIADQPKLPTPPYDRAFVHLIRFFAQQDALPFEEARQRAASVREQLDNLDRYAAFIVSLGRDAVVQGEPDLLDQAFQVAHRASLLRNQ